LLAELNRWGHDVHLEAEPEIYREPRREDVVRWFEERLADDATEIYVAAQDGEPVGYVVSKIEHRPAHPFSHARSRVHVDQLAVAPQARRHGHGRALMAAVHERARAHGVSSVELGVRAFNSAALRFYEALGYAPKSLNLGRAP
jgi:ribosomal protein S18 acetylase RimI-like enzyme